MLACSQNSCAQRGARAVCADEARQKRACRRCHVQYLKVSRKLHEQFVCVKKSALLQGNTQDVCNCIDMCAHTVSPVDHACRHMTITGLHPAYTLTFFVILLCACTLVFHARFRARGCLCWRCTVLHTPFQGASTCWRRFIWNCSLARRRILFLCYSCA
jgi:hypothetical protein